MYLCGCMRGQVNGQCKQYQDSRVKNIAYHQSRFDMWRQRRYTISLLIEYIIRTVSLLELVNPREVMKFFSS